MTFWVAFTQQRALHHLIHVSHGIFSFIYLTARKRLELVCILCTFGYLSRRISSSCILIYRYWNTIPVCNRSLSTNCSLNGCTKMAWLGKAQPPFKKNLRINIRMWTTSRHCVGWYVISAEVVNLYHLKTNPTLIHKQIQNADGNDLSSMFHHHHHNWIYFIQKGSEKVIFDCFLDGMHSFICIFTPHMHSKCKKQNRTAFIFLQRLSTPYQQGKHNWGKRVRYTGNVFVYGQIRFASMLAFQ